MIGHDLDELIGLGPVNALKLKVAPKALPASWR